MRVMTKKREIRASESGSSSADDGIYYFGYGPMVHPIVRHQRGIKVVEEQPAILKNYRLTFAFGGVASVVPQRGYEIHGIVMKCQTKEDWWTLKKSEGGYIPTELEVYPYQKQTTELPVFSPEEDDVHDGILPIRAQVFVMLEFDQSKIERPLERLPQERYLRLIASGMAKYHLDEDYIQDEIMNVPFNPSRKPDNYSQFPVLHLPDIRPSICDETEPTETDDDYLLPRISWEGYQELCQEARDSGNDSCPQHMYFILGSNVIMIRDHPGKTHPGAMWHQANAFGKRDVTFYLHKTHVDSEIPYCETEEDITPAIQAWAENLLVHSIAQGLDAYRVFEFSTDHKDEEESHESVNRLRLLLRLVQSPTEVPLLNAGSKGRRRSTLKKLTHKIKKEFLRSRGATAQLDR